MKKVLLGLVLILICAIMVVSAAMIHDHHKSAYKKAMDKKKYKSVENERVTIYSEVESETSSVSTASINEQLVLREISGGYVDINTNEFYPSQYVRELSSQRAIVDGVSVKITN